MYPSKEFRNGFRALLLDIILHFQHWLRLIDRWITRKFFKPVASFVIKQHGGYCMSQVQSPLLGVLPGQSILLQAQPLDVSGNATTVPAGLVPVWVSSDEAVGTVVPTADGLSAAFVAAAGATPGATVSVSVTLTNVDGTTPTSGPVAVPILTPTTGPLPVASFVILQVNQ